MGRGGRNYVSQREEWGKARKMTCIVTGKRLGNHKKGIPPICKVAWVTEMSTAPRPGGGCNTGREQITLGLKDLGGGGGLGPVKKPIALGGNPRRGTP